MTSHQHCCPECSNTTLRLTTIDSVYMFECMDCGHTTDNPALLEVQQGYKKGKPTKVKPWFQEDKDYVPYNPSIRRDARKFLEFVANMELM